MKEYILKWIKRYGVMVWLIAAVTALAVSLSYAAYVNLDINKWVLSTGKGNQAFFGSNYLYLTDRQEEVFSERRITQTPDDSNAYAFAVQVCNYIYGNQEMVNLDNIDYTFHVKLLPNGSALPSGLSGITVTCGETTQSFSGDTVSFGPTTMTGGAVQTDFYRFRVPAELVNLVRFQIVAEPTQQSYSATNNQKLAAVLTMAEPKDVNNWTGRFIDEKNGTTPASYSGFNYEISGTGEGTLTLTWKSSLQISPWFLEDYQLKPTTADGKNVITMDVGGLDESGMDRPSAYQFQFYKVDKAAIDACGWSELEDLVTVTFPADQGASG